MNEVGVFALRWLRFGTSEVESGRREPRAKPLLGVACPHCTNVDTLSRHCPNRRCLWVSCTCGALAYTRRRHRHPRHGSGRDTCHDPSAAV